ncbi:RNA methyltransferase [Prevotella sp. 10(H)]|uniref:RNA methyltransferase n=1 Tax=Prevotella sp. 10(H) TaxID=1158294 RepID=UPI0004A6EF90|nr:RNA methyltransferase [Prevotella sp. 10(H)]
MRVKKITELDRISIEKFKEAKKTPLIVVLDNIRSLNNIGAVFRTSDAFLLEAVYLCGITACPPNAEIHKTALGAENSVDWCYYENTENAIKELKEKNFILCAIEQAESSIMLNDLILDTTKKYAIVLGNEVKGVRQEVVDMCDCCIEIPQFGTKHSLNVSVAGGIVIWEFFRQLQ